MRRTRATRTGRVNATDADAGANGELECFASSYSSGSPVPLDVSSDCRVTLRAGVLDREAQSQHRLAVVVRDRGTCPLCLSTFSTCGLCLRNQLAISEKPSFGVLRNLERMRLIIRRTRFN